MQTTTTEEIVRVIPWTYSDISFPVFFEPLDPAKIELAGLGDDTRVVIMLDGEGVLGQRTVDKWRAICHMSPRNIAIFGSDPYYYACIEPNQVDCEMQYLIYKQGDPQPEARRRLAEAVLRQWCARDAPQHALERLESRYLAEENALLRGPDAGRFQRLPVLD